MSKIGRIWIKGNPNRGASLGLQYRLVAGRIHDNHTWAIWDRYTGEVAEVLYDKTGCLGYGTVQKRHHELTGASLVPDTEMIAAMDEVS